MSRPEANAIQVFDIPINQPDHHFPKEPHVKHLKIGFPGIPGRETPDLHHLYSKMAGHMRVK
jgi:hypothetical protein